MSGSGGADPGERLARYRRMRDFGTTPEPQGAGAAATATAPSFTVQRHAARRLHYDFRLELDGVLKSWAVPKGPSLDPAERRLAVETEDHPLEYGDFEGTIPARQYGAGEVVLWDRGTWTTDEKNPADALARGRLAFRLRGRKLSGGWKLVRMGGGAKEEGPRNWLLIKERDEAAREGDAAEVTERLPGSVKPDPAAVLPAALAPQLAALAEEPPAGAGWVWEIKYDGYRILARVSAGKARLFTRNGHDWTDRLAHVARALELLAPGESWLDGEIVVVDKDGLPDFQALQNAFEGGATGDIVFYLFDAPWLDGEDLTGLPLVERKRRLAEALTGAGQALRLSEHFGGDPRPALAQACRLGLEGLIGKSADGRYLAGRGRGWIKLKCRPRQEFVIGGYTDPAGSRHGFGALLVGLYDGAGALQYAGRVGTGFDQGKLSRIAARLAALARGSSPFARTPRVPGVHWVEPVLVAELAFAGWTREGQLRQASFLALREDKPARSVKEEVMATTTRERPRTSGPVRVAGVAISNPDRMIWPDKGITKADLARYYETVGKWLMPHLASRPLSLLRCPDGSEAECFFQRHMGQERPAGVETFVWERSSGKRGSYLFVNGIEAVIGMVQRGVIEFHTWGSTLPKADRPDRLTLDLDPAPGLAWERVVEGAQLVRSLLEELGLTSFLKTTGGKGLHVVVPLARRHAWDEAKAFSRALAEHLTRVLPDRFTASLSKERRTGRIFIDYLRNDATSTAVAAYAVRARPGAPVSTPLAWDELTPHLRPAEFDVNTVPMRMAALGADPWAGYAGTRQSITKAARSALGL